VLSRANHVSLWGSKCLIVGEVFGPTLVRLQKAIAKRRIRAGRRIDVMTIIKFVVKVNRGARVPAYVQRIDRSPIQTTTNRKLALIMGRLTAEDAVKSIQTSRCNPELVSVQVRA
jgi:hypothetical protein